VSLEAEQVPVSTQDSAIVVRNSCKMSVVLPENISSTPKGKCIFSSEQSDIIRHFSAQRQNSFNALCIPKHS